MYVIGVNEWDFINVKNKVMMTYESCEIWEEIERVIYECNLVNATFFSNYKLATKIIEEIKARKNYIIFENNDILGKILDEEQRKEFNVDLLKVYELIPTECVE